MSVFFATLSLLVSLNTTAISELDKPYQFSLEHLPEYVVIRCDDIGSPAISIDRRKSRYNSQLEMLQEYLSNRKKRNVRNQSELLTVMSEIGYDYINAYAITEEQKINVVFRKKEEFR